MACRSPRVSILIMWALVACKGEDPEEAPPLESVACSDPYELALPDGSCIRPGVPPDGCAPGFEHDGAYGCNALLPLEPCPEGSIAVPGETTCAPVMPCAAGRWGDIPIDATTQHVDGAYAGGASDGSAAHPWTTIGEAVQAAAPGAIVAIARGTYVETVGIAYKAVRLYGVCPAEVTVVATGAAAPDCPPAAICVLYGAHGTEIHGVSVRGDGAGIGISGVEQVLVERVHVHDTTDQGINAQIDLGPTSLIVRRSLIERSASFGIYATGETTVDASVVRDTLPDAAGGLGYGIVIRTQCPNCERGRGVVTGSVLERNRQAGIFIMAADARVEASVVRDTQPTASNPAFGRGVQIQLFCEGGPTGDYCEPALRANATVQSSLLERNHDSGLAILGADAEVDGITVRDTFPTPNGVRGRAMTINANCMESETGGVCDPAARSRATVTRSLLEQSREFGVIVLGSDATIESTVVRATAPTAAQWFGRGVAAHRACSIVDGIPMCDPSLRASLSLQRSLVEQSHEFGVSIFGSDGLVQQTVVRRSLPNGSDGTWGDGIAVASFETPAAATIENSFVDDSARAGIANFGAFVALSGTHLRCAAIAIAADPYDGMDFELEDRGNNRCGCPNAEDPCAASSVNLMPPSPPSSSD